MNQADEKKNESNGINRSKGLKLVLTLVVIGLVLVFFIPVTNLFRSPPGGTAVAKAAATHPLFSDAAVVLEGKCLDCHGSEAQAPYYANLPIAGSVVQADMEAAVRYFDMCEQLAPPANEPYNEAALAKLEYVVEQGSMPPSRYKALHWNRGLNAEDRRVVRTAIQKTRTENYTTPGVAEAFATDALQPLPGSVPVNAARVALGEKLYHDVRLSGDDTVSCASCHALDTGGCDRTAVSTGIGSAKGPINSPTVYNAVFHLAQFWDGRAVDLAEQAAGPVHNPLEMGSNWEQVLDKLQNDTELVAAFEEAYASGMTGDNIAHAIAEFEKTLVTPGCRFDRYLAGEQDALNKDELAGLALFRENACANCHVGKAMGGQSFELMGRTANYFTDRGDIQEADLGRFNVTARDQDKYKFKVPSLRNVAVTWPYFHDASQKSLADAVNLMAHYQGYRDFTPTETAQVTAFLKTLTGEYRGEMLQ